MTLSEMTPKQILEAWPAKPPKPLKKYTVSELVALKKFGPAVIGGALYLASQAASQTTHDDKFGPAILSKSAEPVPYRSTVG